MHSPPPAKPKQSLKHETFRKTAEPLASMLESGESSTFEVEKGHRSHPGRLVMSPYSLPGRSTGLVGAAASGEMPWRTCVPVSAVPGAAQPPGASFRESVMKREQTSCPSFSDQGAALHVNLTTNQRQLPPDALHVIHTEISACFLSGGPQPREPANFSRAVPPFQWDWVPPLPPFVAFTPPRPQFPCSAQQKGVPGQDSPWGRARLLLGLPPALGLRGSCRGWCCVSL